MIAMKIWCTTTQYAARRAVAGQVIHTKTNAEQPSWGPVGGLVFVIQRKIGLFAAVDVACGTISSINK